MPRDPPRGLSLPVLVWAEGGCANNGTSFEPFLTNIASYGFVVVALGPPNGTGNIFTRGMNDALLWISAKAGTCGKYANVRGEKIAAAGQSCGGLVAYSMRTDDRVDFLGIFNSGFITNTTQAEDNLPAGAPIEPASSIKEIHKPVFWFLGGPTDVAYSFVSCSTRDKATGSM